MRKRRALLIGVLLVLVGLAFAWDFSRGQNNGSSYSSQSQTSNNSGNGTTSKAKKRAGKILVVYFSRRLGVYNGPLKVGNTKRVADFIQKATGADEYEIVPKKKYPRSYDKTTEVAQEEQENNVRPAIKNKLPNVSKYDTIFIGSPIWWSEYPMVVRTFLDKEQKGLANKTLVPFTTHQGSGLGNTEEQLKSQFPKARILSGFSVTGDDAANAEPSVNRWLKRIGVE